jgi:hypothetical protein
MLSVFAAPSGERSEPAEAGGCPSGMCRMPEICGRN